MKIIFDIETTGLYYNFSEVTEIAAIKINDIDKEVDRFHCYIKPLRMPEVDFFKGVFGKAIMAEVEAKKWDTFVSNYGDQYRDEIAEVEEQAQKMYENVLAGDTPYNALRSFADFCEDCDTMIGHNVKFDVNFTNYHMMKRGFPIFLNRICTMETYKTQNKGKANLATCCATLGITLTDAHNAWADVEATKLLYLKEKELGYEMKEVRNTTLEAVHEVMGVIDKKYADILKSFGKSEKAPDEKLEECYNLFNELKTLYEVSKETGLPISQVNGAYIMYSLKNTEAKQALFAANKDFLFNYLVPVAKTLSYREIEEYTATYFDGADFAIKCVK